MRKGKKAASSNKLIKAKIFGYKSKYKYEIRGFFGFSASLLATSRKATKREK